ncbi:MAG: hypothetical protein ACFFBS_05090 [Promethearchaeota archaeon]
MPKSKKNKESVTIVVNADQLSEHNDAMVEELTKFLGEKLPKSNSVRDGNDVIVTSDSALTKSRIRPYVKRFLHIREVNEGLRVISGGGKTNLLLIHRREKYKSY